MDDIGVCVLYGGKLSDGKTVEDLISHVTTIGKKDELRTEIQCENIDYIFQIPNDVINNPNNSFDPYWNCQNINRISEWASKAGINSEGKPYEELCQILNSSKFTQTGIWIWAHDYGRPLRFIFVKGEDELCELEQEVLHGKKPNDEMKYIRFERNYIATRTGFEQDPIAHKKALDILKEVNELFFGNKMNIINSKENY
jgi:hypothetical protein